MTSHAEAGAARRPSAAEESAGDALRIDFRAAAGDRGRVGAAALSAGPADAGPPAADVSTDAAPFGASRASDGFADIIAAAGPGGAPHIKVFNGETGAESASFFAFSPSFTGGV